MVSTPRPADPLRAYAHRAQEYADLLGHLDATAPEDRDRISRWATEQEGLVLDVGCGPGHWTGWLASRGVHIRGLDPVPEFVDIARSAHPGTDFRVGAFRDLTPASCAGILAWYSLIHTPPAEVSRQFSAIHTALRPGGSLLLGLFDALDSREPIPFDHAVTQAWAWPAPLMVTLLEEAGFVVEHQERRTDPGARPHVAVVARRT